MSAHVSTGGNLQLFTGDRILLYVQIRPIHPQPFLLLRIIGYDGFDHLPESRAVVLPFLYGLIPIVREVKNEKE